MAVHSLPAANLASAAGIQAADFKRPDLNLIILLDVSGSMGEAFNRYYYDQFGNQQNLTEAGAPAAPHCFVCCGPVLAAPRI